MHVAEIATSPRRRAPVPGGPTAALLTTEEISDQVAVLHVELAAGTTMAEHEHGASQVVLIPVAGAVEVHHEGRVWTLTAGTAAAHIGVGERVSLANPGAEPASLMVVVSPPEFADRLASWPQA
ncbi:cupin domain-containing protein [Streptomyces sp. HUAS TT20]|uniref:cupin domain-containing protein n=1 Tax=Streptomyces sp. HUAS TT20 TaxID=3447509 RepID=UPI0021D88CB4|nr:cupin domain-containing protein [Streptomyces sp. HUAS 15-9]UXY31977.1 cupin domain-containing protein [Streptomyces sp. HUAS 15-9]